MSESENYRDDDLVRVPKLVAMFEDLTKQAVYEAIENEELDVVRVSPRRTYVVFGSFKNWLRSNYRKAVV